MRIRDLTADHQFLLAKAARLLGTTVRAAHLAPELFQLMGPHLTLEMRSGLDQQHPVVALGRERRERGIVWGIEQYRFAVAGEEVRFVRVVTTIDTLLARPLFDFVAVPVAQFKSFYRALRQLQPRRPQQTQPILAAEDCQRLLDNTVGFLKHGREVLARYGVAQKRGVLLVGEPGNGKTMACRWLRSVCRREGLLWRTFSADDLHELRFRGRGGGGHVWLPRPGVVCFDDIPLPTADCRPSEADRTLLLALLDGMQPAAGVVFVFTTNTEFAELDPAFRRPGRIDQVFELRKPTAELRRRFIEEAWHPDLRQDLELDRVVEQTHGLSFAELAEIKNLLVMGYLSDRRWDWDFAWEAFCQRDDAAPRRQMGFAANGQPNQPGRCRIVASDASK